MDARLCAAETLYETEFGGAYVNAALKKNLRKLKDPREKSLCTNIVYGVEDKLITLNYIISAYSKIEIKKISQYVLIILQTGIYQLLFMNKIPQSAAVNESVKLADKFGQKASKGFINAILRNIIRNGFKYPEEKINYLSVKYSFPLQLCEKWINDFGYEFTEKLMGSFEDPQRTVLRPNILKTNAAELAKMLGSEDIKADISGEALITDGFDIENNDLYRKGYFTVQSLAAQKTSEELTPESGETIIDMCAAPGGKTTHIAEIMNNKGKVLAFDIYPQKIEIIKKNAARLGIDIIEASLKDAAVYDESLSASADRVLCDVPCTGHGMIGRKPDIKYAQTDCAALKKMQKKILANGAAYLKTGGTLIYSTCTIEKEENEDVTGVFLKKHKEFAKEYEKTFYPHIDKTEGFYIFKAVKNG